MNLKKIPSKLYTKGTRAPLILWLYRSILKNCYKLKKLDLIAGEWHRLEVMIQFRGNQGLSNMEEIYREYMNACSFKSIIQYGMMNNDIETQKALIRAAYGQSGKRKYDFLAAICIKNKQFKEFEEIAKHEHFDIAIPKEFYDYMEQNKENKHLYEGLLLPKFDMTNLKKNKESYKGYVESLNEILLHLYKQERLHISLIDRNDKTY